MNEEQEQQQQGQQQQEQQQGQQPTPPTGGEKSSLNMDPNVAALLCYLGGWITGLIFYLLEKENSYVRFHAMQSLITFAALGIITLVAGVIPVIGWIVAALAPILIAVVWILMMVKAYQGERYKLPIVGDMAEKYI